MKVGIISDLHGKDCWKNFIKGESIDKWVFLGDYVDSYTHSNEELLTNLKEIIKFKQDNFDKVVLLWGNHEFNYLYLHTTAFQCSGRRDEVQFDFYDILNSNERLFLNAYQIENTIFTHAGIQHDWFINRFKGDVTSNIANQLNNPKNTLQEIILHNTGYVRGGRMRDVGGIFWCDRSELKKPLKGFTQVVGHTPCKQIFKYQNKNSFVWFCDVLDNKEKFLILEF